MVTTTGDISGRNPSGGTIYIYIYICLFLFYNKRKRKSGGREKQDHVLLI
jgi:hypothetical protein